MAEDDERELRRRKEQEKQEEQEEEEAVFTRESNANEDPPNAQQVQRLATPQTEEDLLSVLVKFEGDPLNAQHAQHGHKPQEEEAVLTRDETRGGSANTGGFGS